TPSTWRKPSPACLGRSRPPAEARWRRRWASAWPGAWYRPRASRSAPKARSATTFFLAAAIPRFARGRLADHAAKAEVAGRRVDRLRHARGRPVAAAIVRRAQERTALHHLARDGQRNARIEAALARGPIRAAAARVHAGRR